MQVANVDVVQSRLASIDRPRTARWRRAPAWGVGASACVVATAAALLAVLAPQANAAAVLEEVIVTAQKREQALMDTPLSITALTAADIEGRHLENLGAIAEFTPNLVFDRGTGNTGGSGNVQVYIRGVGQSDYLFTFDPGVGIYVDGVYFARSVGGLLDLVDLERVEVLRGPQGTLFGKNTVGGAISVISRKPEQTFGAQVQITGGSDDRINVKGALNVPLVDEVLATRLSFAYEQQDGYVDRPLQGIETGDIDGGVFRGQLLWAPTANLELLVSGDVTRKREESIAEVLMAIDPTAPLLGLWNALVAPALGPGVQYDARFLVDDPYTSLGTGPSRSDLDVYGVSGTITWQAHERLSIKSITAYRNQNAAFAADTDHSPLDYLVSETNNEQDQVSQELQVNGVAFGGRLNWIGGVFYFHEDASDASDFGLGVGLFDALESLPAPLIPLALGVACPAPFPAPCLGGAGNPFNIGLDLDVLIDTEIEIDSWAVYGQGTYNLTDRLGFTAGLRYSYDKKDFSVSTFRQASGGVAAAAQASESWDDLAPRLALEYRWTEDLMSYASVARGYKSGGFNGRPSAQLAAITVFDPETVWAYEVGVKATAFDRRLRASVAGFFMDYSDLQLTSVSADPTGALVILVQNAGEAEMKGMELELAVRPLPALELQVGVGYLDAEYTELNPDVDPAITLDSALPKAPEWTLHAGGSYQWPLGGWGAILGRIDYAYQSEVFHTPNNVSVIAQDGYGLLRASLTVSPQAGNWDLSVFGTNITDEVYTVNGLSGLDTVGTAGAVHGRPAQWGATLRYRF